MEAGTDKKPSGVEWVRRRRIQRHTGEKVGHAIQDAKREIESRWSINTG